MKLEHENKNTQITEDDPSNETKVWTRNFLLSLLIHLILIIALLFIYDASNGKSKINSGFFYVETKKIEKQNARIQKQPLDKLEEQNKIESPKKNNDETSTQFLTYSDLNADTTNLDQLYKEPTLNLSIKYPKGWTFIDQTRNKKLDGVTFWAADGFYNPPPYIHLEVVEKYLFNEKRYKHKIKLYDCEAYYNDPEELSGQVTQVFYLRTEADEDYQIKLIMDGLNNFYAFQPEFLGMLKSFRFGKSWY